MTWVLDNVDLIGRLSLEHLRLAIPPIILGLVIAIPLGWLAYRFKLTRGLLLTLAGRLYTIPSLALLPILPAVLGISFLSSLNLTIALTIYAVAIMARSVGVLIGVQSLGYLFTNGLQRGIVAEVLVGVVLVVVLALIVDALLAGLGRALMPWAPRRAVRPRLERPHRRFLAGGA